MIAVVLSTNLRLVDAPGNVLIPAKASGLRKDSIANVSQVITVDREFLIELAGRVRGRLLKDIETGLRLVLGLQVRSSWLRLPFQPRRLIFATAAS